MVGLDPAADRVWQHIDWNAMFGPVDLAGVRIMTPNKSWRHRYSSNERGHFQHGDGVRYEINGQGFRDEDFSIERIPGTLRIAFVGDSFGFGAGVEAGYSVPDLLEPLLSERMGCPVEVLNFSTPGYSARHEHRLLRQQVMDYHPDLVLVWYFLNDAKGAPEFLKFLGSDEKDRRYYFRTLGKISALARLLGRRLDARKRNRDILTYYRDAYEPTSEEWAETRKSLAGMAETLARHEVPGVLFVHPMLFRLEFNYPFADLHAQVVTTANELGIEAHDLLPAFEGRSSTELWVHPSDQHPNEVGQKIGADFAVGPISERLPVCDGDSSQPARGPGPRGDGVAN